MGHLTSGPRAARGSQVTGAIIPTLSHAGFRQNTKLKRCTGLTYHQECTEPQAQGAASLPHGGVVPPGTRPPN